ncbi:YihY/virulence factor BrkB family protein [Streptomyces kunmingensis]|uniref:YihY/virulence factor BrkB family protein n=1 Tax=Streptomyces kunmingensis TaxID=68225 RepID=A0ABU6C7K0_9ACTN|nr:YhjD/YihY/BrkB family envelope integrity protein [Streptomyces kunmingensis]MEB3959825.1 YihY/virulence factor BrkB family protein [Streptomyces kunmingensis]
MPIVGAVPPLVGRVLQQLVHVNLLDMATRLAAQAFLAALPMLIAVTSFCPPPVRRQMQRSLQTMLGSDGAVVAKAEQLTGGGDTALHNWGFAGVLVALLSATSFTRALQRLCERAWHLPRSGVRLAAWRWAAWLLVWLSVLVVQGALHKAFGVGAVLGIPLQCATVTLMCWWTQHLLLAGRVAWPALLPGAVLTGAGVVAFTLLSQLWLPRALHMSLNRYGTLGSVFTLLSWLIVYFTVVVFGIAVGRTLAQEDFVRRRLGEADTPPSH